MKTNILISCDNIKLEEQYYLSFWNYSSEIVIPVRIIHSVWDSLIKILPTILKSVTLISKYKIKGISCTPSAVPSTYRWNELEVLLTRHINWNKHVVIENLKKKHECIMGKLRHILVALFIQWIVELIYFVSQFRNDFDVTYNKIPPNALRVLT